MTIMWYIKHSRRNIIITISNNKNNIILNTSLRKWGYKNSLKYITYAITEFINNICIKLLTLNLLDITIILNGLSPYRKLILKTIITSRVKGNAFSIKSISDKTPFAHNGCRNSTIRSL